MSWLVVLLYSYIHPLWYINIYSQILLHFNNRSIRESFIRAKYIDKAFVSKLPGPKSASKAKGWSVKRKPKRSPSKDVASSQDNSDEEADLTSGIMEGMLNDLDLEIYPWMLVLYYAVIYLLSTKLL